MISEWFYIFKMSIIVYCPLLEARFFAINIKKNKE
jgi:hypothetical protein